MLSAMADGAKGDGGGLAVLLATLAGNAFLVLGTLVLATCTVLTGWIPLPGGGRVFFFWARLWGRLVLLTSGVRWRVEHLVPLDRQRTWVFLANHQSLYDIPLLLASLPFPVRFMAKRELFSIPIFGWAIRMGGFIPVDRGAGKGARESFRAATARLERGGSVLLFPEETRSLDGRLLPFKRGGFLLAQMAAAPVVPVGIRGTLGVRRKDSFRIHPGVALVRYGAPIESCGPAVHDDAAAATGGRRDTAALVARVRAAIAELAGVDAGEADEEAPAAARRRDRRARRADGMVGEAAESAAPAARPAD
jgi:1-acyl-sn-glycerol-3-phosphate acyltransferase